MKASELVYKLGGLIAKHGDCEVLLDTDCCSDFDRIYSSCEGAHFEPGLGFWTDQNDLPQTFWGEEDFREYHPDEEPPEFHRYMVVSG